MVTRNNPLLALITLLKRIAKLRATISELVIIIITLTCIAYATIGLWIIYQRPDNTPLTTEELGLILAFAGLQGVAFFKGKKDD